MMHSIILGISSILVIVAGFLLSQILGKKIDERKNKKNIESTEKK